MIIDTDVLIWSMRGYKKAADAITDNSPFAITWITYMELIKGARDRVEQKAIVSEITRLGIQILHSSAEQSALAITILRDNYFESLLSIADAINAAIAISTGNELLSANKKCYGSISGLKYVEYQPWISE